VTGTSDLPIQAGTPTPFVEAPRPAPAPRPFTPPPHQRVGYGIACSGVVPGFRFDYNLDRLGPVTHFNPGTAVRLVGNHRVGDNYMLGNVVVGRVSAADDDGWVRVVLTEPVTVGPNDVLSLGPRLSFH
jgi:hypothetical protein